MPTQDLHWKGPEKTLWPWAVLEYPTSLFRLAAHVYPSETRGTVMVEMVIAGVEGWRLGPHSPRDFRYDMRLHHANLVTPHEGREITLNGPLEVQSEELRENPDRCAFRLVREIYEAFGLREEEIPAEFDRASGRLTIS